MLKNFSGNLNLQTRETVHSSHVAGRQWEKAKKNRTTIGSKIKQQMSRDWANGRLKWSNTVSGDCSVVVGLNRWSSSTGCSVVSMSVGGDLTSRWTVLLHKSTRWSSKWVACAHVKTSFGTTNWWLPHQTWFTSEDAACNGAAGVCLSIGWDFWEETKRSTSSLTPSLNQQSRREDHQYKEKANIHSSSLIRRETCFHISSLDSYTCTRKEEKSL